MARRIDQEQTREKMSQKRKNLITLNEWENISMLYVIYVRIKN
jgi:hypothetical protein